MQLQSIFAVLLLIAALVNEGKSQNSTGTAEKQIEL